MNRPVWRRAAIDRPPRPQRSFDPGLQHERTALAWERTAIAVIVAGLVLSRYAAIESYWVFAVFGLAQTAFGAGLLIWSGAHYEELHQPLRDGSDVVHPLAVRLVAVVTLACIGTALVMAVIVLLWA